MIERDLISYRIERSKEAIVEAESMATISHWNACTNRLYYSCFYAVLALLAKNKMAAAKHTGIRSLFNLHFVKTKMVPDKFGKLYNNLFIFRQQSDYEDFFVMEKEQVIPWINQSKEFITFIEKLIENNES
jgi:uncharacterized protein (UPF0332 family)